ncbi:MAG TPA: hypothetical protein VGV68_07170 [Terriglobia bacterium]|nr:hypothetical protein [Terriglobia bacterium]
MPDENRPLPSQLSSNHRRVISIRMRLIEESCFRLLDLFRAVETIFILRQPLPMQKSEKVNTGVQELRSLMNQMKSDLGLYCSNEDAHREAAALMAAMTTSIEELHPHHLKGYGSIPDPVAKYLEIRLSNLLQVMKKIKRVLDTPPAEEKSEG